jgi:hypothetical protein
VARKRDRWKRHQGKLDPRRLVFVDETWAKTNMTRSHGRAPRGQRLVGKVPHGRWTTMTFIAACASTASTRPSCSMARSTASGSGPGSSRC